MFCILGGIVACGSGVLSNFSLHGQGFGELDLVTMMIALGGLVAGIVGVCILCLIGRNS
jgi:hypothetical protein